MSGVTNFPGALDDDSSMYDVTDNVTQIIAVHHNNLKEAVKAVEAKMGIDVSPAATSLDYLLRNPSAGHRHSGASGQGRRVSHADLLDTATGNPHSIYQQATYLGQPSGYAPLGPSGLLAPSYMGYSSIATEIRFLANDQRWRNLNPTQFNLPSYLATSGLFPAADGVWRIPAGSGGGGGGGGTGVAQSYLGYDAIGASVENMGNWKAYTKTLVVTTPGFLASIQAYVSISSRAGSEAFSALLWSDNAGQPQTLLAMASTTALARATGTGRWLAVPIGIWLGVGTYHIGFGASQVNNSQIAYDTGTDITFQSAGSFFDDYVSGDTLTTTARQYSVRADWLTGGAGNPGAYEDFAELLVPTYGHAPNASYPGSRMVVNGTLDSTGGVNRAMTWPVVWPGRDGVSAVTAIYPGFALWHRDGTDMPSGDVTAVFDLGVARSIYRAMALGITWQAAGQAHHPIEFHVHYSDDNSTFTEVGSGLTSMAGLPGVDTQWALNIDPAGASHRYWRFRFVPYNSGGDDWFQLHRLRLLGSR